MKLLHVSDLRIGAAFPDVPLRAEALREARLDAVRSLLGLAERELVSCILLAGNTLADNRISHRELLDLVSILANSPCPVGLLPGLTDPHTADSPYRRREELFTAPLHVLAERKPWPVGEAVVYPEPVLHRHSAGPLLDWVPSEGLRIGLACRTPDTADLPELDYLAMGGSLQPITQGAACWPGTPEVLEPGHEPGSAVVVTLNPGRPPRMRPVPIGQLTWLCWQRTVSDPQSLVEELDGLEHPASTLLDLTLDGTLTRDDLLSLLEVFESRRGRFYQLRLEQRVQLSRDQPLYGNRLLAEVAERLLAQAAQPGTSSRDQVPDSPEMARHALIRLSRLLAQAPSEDLS